jgi:HAD superfamily hydrolase (TIGR01509 family)
MDNRPQAIIFDFGNVLEGPLNPQAFELELARMASEFGFEDGQALWSHIYVSDAWEKAKRGQLSRQAFWKDRLDLLGLTTDESRSAFKRRLFQFHDVFPAMRSLLEELKPRYRLAVLSNTARKDLQTHLEEGKGLKGVFNLVISSAAEGLAKPEPEIYKLALSRLMIPPGEALFIDDMERNTRAAELMEIRSIIFTTPEALWRELKTQQCL